MIPALQMLPMKKLYTRDRKIWHLTAKFSENIFQLNKTRLASSHYSILTLKRVLSKAVHQSILGSVWPYHKEYAAE